MCHGHDVHGRPLVREEQSKRRIVAGVQRSGNSALVALASAMQLTFQQSGAAFPPITDEIVSAASNRPTGGSNEQVRVAGSAAQARPDRPVLQAVAPDDRSAPLSAAGGQGRHLSSCTPGLIEEEDESYHK
jgi:hypothetical protein